LGAVAVAGEIEGENSLKLNIGLKSAGINGGIPLIAPKTADLRVILRFSCKSSTYFCRYGPVWSNNGKISAY